MRIVIVREVRMVVMRVVAMWPVAVGRVTMAGALQATPRGFLCCICPRKLNCREKHHGEKRPNECEKQGRPAKRGKGSCDRLVL